MQSQSFKKNESTGLKPKHELGLIGQTFDLLAEKLNARKQALEQALIKAQDANTAKSQFSASMSHEIENLSQQNLWDDVAVTWPELKISYQRLCNKIKNDMPL